MYICILHIILCVSSIYLSILGYFHDQLLYLDTRVMGYIFGLIIAKLGDITPVFKFQKVQITCELFRSVYIYIYPYVPEIWYIIECAYMFLYIYILYTYIYICVCIQKIYMWRYTRYLCVRKYGHGVPVRVYIENQDVLRIVNRWRSRCMTLESNIYHT